MPVTWNPWHGCRKISAGCQNCYVYRSDAQHGRDSSLVTKTRNFDLPLRRGRGGGYKIPPGELVYTCFTSDLLLEDADPWRDEIWDMMRLRHDLQFLFITKRIHRFSQCLPYDWGTGYPNVHICCTVENQDRADYRLPLFHEAPALHKSIVCEPLLGPIDLSPYLDNAIELVLAGGESGNLARTCEYNWVLALRQQCMAHGVSFRFKQTGARLRKNGKLYRIPRPQQHRQARKAAIDYRPEDKFDLIQMPEEENHAEH